MVVRTFVVRDVRDRPVARLPGAVEQTGALRPLAGARDLSVSSPNGNFGQTDQCFRPLGNLEGEGYCVDLAGRVYVTFSLFWAAGP